MSQMADKSIRQKCNQDSVFVSRLSPCHPIVVRSLYRSAAVRLFENSALKTVHHHHSIMVLYDWLTADIKPPKTLRCSRLTVGTVLKMSNTVDRGRVKWTFRIYHSSPQHTVINLIQYDTSALFICFSHNVKCFHPKLDGEIYVPVLTNKNHRVKFEGKTKKRDCLGGLLTKKRQRRLKEWDEMWVHPSTLT